MKWKSLTRQKFLLSFFDSRECYQTKEINGFVLAKYFSNNTHRWEVMVYTPESYQKAISTYHQFVKVPDPQVSNKDQTTIF